MLLTSAQSFTTPLGTISTWIESNGREAILSSDDSITTPGHQLTLKTCEIPQSEMAEDRKVEQSKIWRWYIRKRNSEKESLLLFCRLLNPNSSTSWDYNSGERLDAIEIVDDSYQLHIGTEDAQL